MQIGKWLFERVAGSNLSRILVDLFGSASNKQTVGQVGLFVWPGLNGSNNKREALSKCDRD
jgi:hypothetical protein